MKLLISNVFTGDDNNKAESFFINMIKTLKRKNTCYLCRRFDKFFILRETDEGETLLAGDFMDMLIEKTDWAKIPKALIGYIVIKTFDK